MQIIQYSDINSFHLLTILFLRYVYIICVFKLYTVLCSSPSLDILLAKKKKIKIYMIILDLLFSFYSCIYYIIDLFLSHQSYCFLLVVATYYFIWTSCSLFKHFSISEHILFIMLCYWEQYHIEHSQNYSSVLIGKYFIKHIPRNETARSVYLFSNIKRYYHIVLQ